MATNGAGTTGFLYLYTNVNSRWVRVLNLKHKYVQLRRKHRRKSIKTNLAVGLKSKIVYSLKDIAKRMKTQATH